jgi:hypothetical protein
MMNLILKIVVIATPVALAVLNGANYDGANIMQPDMDEAVSAVGSAVTALAAYLLLFKR